MHPALHRALMAYRPLYLSGLLRDGQYRLPQRAGVPVPPRQRGVLIAFTGLWQAAFRHRSRP